MIVSASFVKAMRVVAADPTSENSIAILNILCEQSADDNYYGQFLRKALYFLTSTSLVTSGRSELAGWLSASEDAILDAGSPEWSPVVISARSLLASVNQTAPTPASIADAKEALSTAIDLATAILEGRLEE